MLLLLRHCGVPQNLSLGVTLLTGTLEPTARILPRLLIVARSVIWRRRAVTGEPQAADLRPPGLTHHCSPPGQTGSWWPCGASPFRRSRSPLRRARSWRLPGPCGRYSPASRSGPTSGIRVDELSRQPVCLRVVARQVRSSTMLWRRLHRHTGGHAQPVRTRRGGRSVNETWPKVGRSSSPCTARRICASSSALMGVPEASRSAPGWRRCRAWPSWSGSRWAKQWSNPSACFPMQRVPVFSHQCGQVGQSGAGAWSSAWISATAQLYAKSLVGCDTVLVRIQTQIRSFWHPQREPTHIPRPGGHRVAGI